MQLIVTGGCGCEKAWSGNQWLTSDMSIISVSPYGNIKAKRPGIATVKVVSTIEPQNLMRKNKFVALDNGKKATFECRVKPPFVGTSKPWIELETGNIYCIFFSNSNNMKPLKGASSALLLGCLSVSGTRKTMNITSEFNNVIITILENSDVQIHRCTNESLSMSSRVDVGVPKTEVEMIVMLSAAGQKMIIRYEVDESQIPVNPSFGFCLTVAFLDFIVVIIIVKVGQRRKLKKEM
ncbi:hypothetical protein Bca4012_098008 [Brassica carinata]